MNIRSFNEAMKILHPDTNFSTSNTSLGDDTVNIVEEPKQESFILAEIARCAAEQKEKAAAETAVNATSQVTAIPPVNETPQVGFTSPVDTIPPVDTASPVQPESSFLADDRDLSVNNTDLSSELSIYLTELVEEIGFTQEEVIKRAGIDEVLGSQIFSGITAPMFNTLFRICLVATFNLTETQKAITLAGFKPLNPNGARDSILIHGLIHMKSISEINNFLYTEDLTLL